MKVLFLIPPKTTILNRDFAATQIVPSVGIASMIGAVQNDFPEVRFLDGFAERQTLKTALKHIADFRPDVIAVSALTTQINDAADTVAEYKKIDPRAVSVVGGPHTSKIPEDTTREFPVFDYVVAGEGEKTLLELLTALRDESSTDGIAGLFASDNGGARGTQRPFMDDLDDLPFPEWKHFNPTAYGASFRNRGERRRELAVSINRGCPFQCIFCAKIMGSRVRKRSIPRVIEEIERDMSDFGANQILFTDETFTVDRACVEELCETIMRKDIHKRISWICDTRPDMVDEELIKLMSRAGCFFLCFGADSTSDETLKYMRKEATASSIRAAVSACRKNGVATQAAYIFGLPTDTIESINSNARGAMEVDSDFATFSILVPYPGTKIMEMAEKKTEGLVLLSRDWRLYGKQLGYALETSTLNRSALERCQRRAYMRFYLRPRKIMNIFRIADVKIVLLYFMSHVLKSMGLRPKNLSANGEKV